MTVTKDVEESCCLVHLKVSYLQDGDRQGHRSRAFTEKKVVVSIFEHFYVYEHMINERSRKKNGGYSLYPWPGEKADPVASLRRGTEASLHRAPKTP